MSPPAYGSAVFANPTATLQANQPWEADISAAGADNTSGPVASTVQVESPLNVGLPDDVRFGIYWCQTLTQSYSLRTSAVVDAGWLPAAHPPVPDCRIRIIGEMFVVS